jgi:hypothetical protein
MDTQTTVQLAEARDVARTRFSVADPALDDDDLPPLGPEVRVRTISIDVPVDDLEWFERYAEYRNALVAVRAAKDKTKAHRQHSRKAMVERAVRKVSMQQQAKMQGHIKALGPLPASDDKEAMEEYAEKVLARLKKQG